MKKIPGGGPPDPRPRRSTTPKEGGWYATDVTLQQAIPTTANKVNRRFRKRWRQPQILHFCGDDRRIRSMHVLIRPRLLPHTSIVPVKLQDLRPSPSFTKSSIVLLKTPATRSQLLHFFKRSCVHYVMVSKNQWKPFCLATQLMGPCALRHGIQNSTEAILACHSALSRE